MASTFIPNEGYKISTDGRSCLLKFLTIGKIFTEKQIKDFSFAVAELMTGLENDRHGTEIPFLPRHNQKILSIGSLSSQAGDTAYKFTDDNGVKFWMEGKLKLSPPAEYIEIENRHARDFYEGYGTISLTHEDSHVTFTAKSGFNSLIICTSGDAAKRERKIRHNRFGRRLIKINRANEFAQKIAAQIKATAWAINDVIYSNSKVLHAPYAHIPEIVQMAGTNKHMLAGDFHERLSARFTDDLINLCLLPSVLCKPSAFYQERERRFHFTMPQDQGKPVFVEIPSLKEHLELLS